MVIRIESHFSAYWRSEGARQSDNLDVPARTAGRPLRTHARSVSELSADPAIDSSSRSRSELSGRRSAKESTLGMLPCGLQGGGHLCDAGTLMPGNLELFRSRLGAVLSRS